MSDSEPVVEADQLKQEMEKVAAAANQLVAGDSSFSQLIATMLAARQLYAMCMYELEWLVREGDWKVKDIPEMTDQNKMMLKEILVNAAAVQAQQPFDENVLFQGMSNTVFPWMQRVVVKHSEHQIKERQKFFEEKEKARVATPIDVGLSISDKPLYRQVPLLLVGEKHVLAWAMAKIKSHIASTDAVRQIVELVEFAPKDPSEKTIHVPVGEWQGCANSNNGFQRVYEKCVLMQLSEPVDALLVPNLLPAYKGMPFVSVTTRANEIQFKLKKWANIAGALLIGGLPLDRPLKANELNLPEFETLRVHNVLRGVSAVPTDVPDQWDIHVGAQVAATVSTEELDSYKKSSIVVE